MSFPTEDSVIDLKTSCNIEDAVAKMLGWLQGPICFKASELDTNFITEDQLKYLDTLLFTLSEHLNDLREGAMLKASEAMALGCNQSEQDELIAAVIDIEDNINRAKLFLIEIEDELNKKEYSLIKLDNVATDKEGERQITLKSLDDWAKKTHNISVLDYLDRPAINNQSAISTVKVSRHREQEKLIINAIKELGLDPKSLPKNDPGKSGLKSKTRNTLGNNQLFSGTRVFNKAWDRLLEYNEIVYEKNNPTPK